MLHKDLNVLKVTHIWESSVLSFVDKVLCCHCPDIFLSYYTIKRNAYDVRTKDQLVTPQTRIQFGDSAVKVKGCLLWNRIDKNMLEYRLYKSIKDHLVKYNISTYLGQQILEKVSGLKFQTVFFLYLPLILYHIFFLYEL